MESHPMPSDITAFFADGTVHRHLTPGAPILDEAQLVALFSQNGTNPLRILRGRMTVNAFTIAGVHICIAHRGFHVYDAHKTSNSNGSGALYLARSEDKALGWLVQFLPHFVRTSRHRHAIKTERFINLAGHCLLDLEDAEVVLRNRDYVVPPGTIHELRTEGWPALNLIIISGHPDPLSMEDHIYVPL